jgi:MoaA/NifB/PqqE/SkfB family radical SAM enzyme/spore coat polysaccharide biosynthesis protein SpsF (cytidylyltransferase family)
VDRSGHARPMKAARDRKDGIMKEAVAVIQCEPGQGWERLLEPCPNVTLLENMVGRLLRIHGVRAVYLFADDASGRSALLAEARRLNVRVLHRGPSALPAWLGLAWRCLFAAAVVRVRDDSPFVDSKVADAMVGKLLETNADCVYGVDFPQGTVPSQIMSPAFLLRTAVKHVKTFASRAHLAQAIRGPLKGGKAVYVRMSECYDVTAVPQSLAVKSREDLASICEIYGGIDLAQLCLDDAVTLYSDEEKFIAYLTKLRETSQAPHRINAVLNRYEAERGRPHLRAFPISLGLNIMPICDVDCQFCSFSPQQMDNRDRVTLEEFKQLDWLKYVSELALWGGIGESLINPEFPKIFEYALERFPHLKIGLSTIGKSLKPAISDRLVGRLDFLNVSLNAARRETHAKIVKAGQFDRVVANLRYLMDQRKAKGATLPKVHLSMVIMRENVEEIVEFIDLAKDLGVDKAVFSHYLTTTIEGNRKVGEESSLYHHQELTDELILRTKERAERLGVDVQLPLPFSVKDYHILFSARSESGPSGDCFLPWTNCYLSVDERGHREMLFCCSGMYLRTPYDIHQLDEANFMKLWNGPVPQHFRKTTNVPDGNPLCTFCKTEDRFDPANKKIYEIDRVFGDVLETMSGQGHSSPLLTVTKHRVP